MRRKFLFPCFFLATSLLAIFLMPATVYGASAGSSGTVTVSVTSSISITPATFSVDLGTINGTGGLVSANQTWTVKTNNKAGYQLTLQSDATTPAMRADTPGTDSFADFAGPAPWYVAAADSAFGFSLPNNPPNYRGFNGMTPYVVDSFSNNTSGRDTTVTFMAEVGSSHLQESSAYTANVTATATTL